MVVGLVSIFVVHEWRWLGPKVGGGSHNSSATAYHTIFGLLSVLLAWIQPLNSLLRCGPQHRLRPLFNWAHRSVGVVSFLFASAAIFIACVYFYKHLTSSRNAVIFACLCVGFIVGCAILLEIIAWKARSKKQFLLPEDPEAEKHLDSSADPDYHYLAQGVIFSIVTAALIGFCSALSAIIAQKD
uniref:Cytochrome b561 domain-containing protein n=1 Tax=Steinernema glaseri TaxID=37863 RepID=A0A1I7ZW20_9BILA